jgi:starvation-inducible DNA-binding protein
MKPNLDIPDKSRAAVVTILNDLLSDEYLLYTKTRNYHWNVVGPQFNDLHKFFEAQYEELNDIVDEMAERATSLGGKAAGTLAEFVKTTRLRERPGEHPDARGMLSDLLADHETIIRQLRADLAVTMDRHGDAGTSDFLTGVMEKHEKMAWMLRAFLAG